MKTLIAILSFLVFNSANAQILPAADFVSKKFATAYELQEAVLIIQQNVVALSTKEQFREYFSILPDLQKQAQELDLESIHPGGVQALGELMSSYGLRWLDVSTDDAAMIQLHLQWMTPDSAYRYVYIAAELIIKSAPNDAKTIASHLQLFIDYSKAHYTAEPYIEMSYRDLLSQLAVKSLRTLELTDEESNLFWIRMVSNQDSMATLVSFLLEQSYLVTPENRDRLGPLMTYFKEAYGLVTKDVFPVSISVRVSVGDIAVEVLDKSIMFAWPQKDDDIRAAVNSLSVSQSLSLADRLNTLGQQLTDASDDQINLTADELVFQLTLLGAYEKAQDFASVFYSTNLSAIREFKKTEGSYLLKDKNNKNAWSLTYLRYSDTEFFVFLTDLKNDDKSYVFDTMEYDYASMSFIAYNKKSPSGRSFFIKLEFIGTEKIALEVPDLENGTTRYSGTRSTESLDQGLTVVAEAPQINHQIKAEIKVAKKKINVVVSMVSANGRYMAQIYLNGDTPILAEGFFSWVDGYIYLTSPGPLDPDVMQLRIKAQEDGFYTGYIFSKRIGTVMPIHFEDGDK